MRATSASAISRLLKKAGYGVVTTRSREGLLVTRDFRGASVTAQFDLEEMAIRRAKDVAEFLCLKGFKVRQYEMIVYVTKSEDVNG